MITTFLEERPNVRSMARLVAMILAVAAITIILTCCFIAIYVTVHARTHGDRAADSISSVGGLILQLAALLTTTVGGIWVALEKRKRGTDDPTVAQTQVTISGPAGAAPTLSVTPPTQ